MNQAGRKIFNAAKRERLWLLYEYLEQNWALEHWELLVIDTSGFYRILSKYLVMFKRKPTLN